MNSDSKLVLSQLGELASTWSLPVDVTDLDWDCGRVRNFLATVRVSAHGLADILNEFGRRGEVAHKLATAIALAMLKSQEEQFNTQGYVAMWFLAQDSQPESRGYAALQIGRAKLHGIGVVRDMAEGLNEIYRLVHGSFPDPVVALAYTVLADFWSRDDGLPACHLAARQFYCDAARRDSRCAEAAYRTGILLCARRRKRYAEIASEREAAEYFSVAADWGHTQSAEALLSLLRCQLKDLGRMGSRYERFAPLASTGDKRFLSEAVRYLQGASQVR